MAPRPSRSNWPLVDTIYCEAKCADEDVYYSGSDNDQYESPRQRKRRYELAGQRFLAGSAPRLFSASLTGPFESSRGWKNPWASKTQSTRIAQQPNTQISLAAKPHNNVKITKHLVKHISTKPRPDSAECHLPSPQSLKTASSASERHPFLEDDELKAVEAWCHGVRSAEPKPMHPLTTQATDAASALKRKTSHKWLGVVPDNKRSKPNHPETNASIAPKTRTPTIPYIPIQGDEQSRLGSSTNFPPRDSTRQLISPPKLAPNLRNAIRSTVLPKGKPNDELSQEQQAAATLSSPVSLRIIKQEKTSAELSPLKFKAKVHSISNAVSNHPNTTASHGTAGYEPVRKPHRVSDDESFVFDIVFEPLSNSSDSDEGEAAQELTHEADAVLEKDRNGPSMPNENLDPEKDNSASSELSELSDSPKLSDLEEASDAAESESAEAPDATERDASEVSAITEAGVADAKAASEAVGMADDVDPGLPGEAEHGSNSEQISIEDVSETGEPASPVEVDVSHTMLQEESPVEAGASHTVLEEESPVEADPSHAMLEEETAGPGSNDSLDESDAIASQQPQRDVVESDAEPNTAGHILDPITAAGERVGVVLRVTAGPSTQSEAGDVVPPCPKVKKESSEFSLKAMFRNLVPTNPWASPTRLASDPTQIIQESVVPKMEEHVLPSVEDVAMEMHEGSQRVVERDFRAGDYTTATTERVTAEEATESQQQAPFEQDISMRSERLSPPQLQPVGIPPTERTPTIPERDEVMAGTEPTPNSQILEAETEVGAQNGALQKQSSPFAQETTTALPTVAREVSPPVTTPTTPARTKNASPAVRPRNSEPRFAFKSFAAFTTPSPERLRVQKRRKLPGSSLRHPRLKGILSSVVTGSPRRTSNRVSWYLPGEPEAHVGGGADLPRASSPPPRTPLAELPTAYNDKFARHFSSVVKRTDGLRHRFRVAADTDRPVESLGSSGLGLNAVPPSSNARAVGTAATVQEEEAGAAGNADAGNRDESGPRERDTSVEPMDEVEDMVREMGDFWQAWDVDAELDAAKKTQADVTTMRAGPQSQTAWR